MTNYRPWSEVRAERRRRQADVLARWFKLESPPVDATPSGFVVIELVPDGGVPLVVGGTLEATEDEARRHVRRLTWTHTGRRYAVAVVGPPLLDPVVEREENP